MDGSVIDFMGYLGYSSYHEYQKNSGYLSYPRQSRCNSSWANFDAVGKRGDGVQTGDDQWT
jgi:hypothetical protein